MQVLSYLFICIWFPVPHEYCLPLSMSNPLPANSPLLIYSWYIALVVSPWLPPSYSTQNTNSNHMSKPSQSTIFHPFNHSITHFLWCYTHIKTHLFSLLFFIPSLHTTCTFSILGQSLALLACALGRLGWRFVIWATLGASSADPEKGQPHSTTQAPLLVWPPLAATKHYDPLRSKCLQSVEMFALCLWLMLRLKVKYWT